MNGLAVLVLRYTSPGQREFQVPLNFTFRGVQIPLGLVLITTTLFLIAVVNSVHQPIATMQAPPFLFCSTLCSRFRNARAERGGTAHVENGSIQSRTGIGVDSRGRGRGVPVISSSRSATLRALSPGNVLDRIKPGRRDLVVLMSGSCDARLRAKTNSRRSVVR